MTGFCLSSRLSVRLCIFNTGARGVMIEGATGVETFVWATGSTQAECGLVACARAARHCGAVVSLGDACAWAARGSCQPRFYPASIASV